MESKTKQRIIGACVVVGLVIVLLPLFQGGKDVPAETTLVKAPPFPEQSQQVASADSAMVPDDVIVDRPSMQPNPAALQAQATEQPKPTPDQPQKPNTDQAQNTEEPNLLANRPSIINQTQPDNAVAAPPSTAENSEKPALDTGNPAVKAMELAPAITDEEDQAPASIAVRQTQEAKTPGRKVMQVARHDKKNMASKQLMANKTRSKLIKLEAATGDNGLASIKGSAWVVQIGSFKNKTNALRLVNKLRLNGYHAFMQHVAMTAGENTRVFVGPESQHARARTLAQRLESDLHVKPIVISYKPLTL